MTRMPDGRWAVDSFTTEGISYIVDAEEGTCSCPYHARTGQPCKHLIWLKVELRMPVAELPSDAELKALFA